MTLPRVLITAGPTHEAIDAVRYIGNRSSGRMGVELARAAINRGCPTTLLLGPTALAMDARPSLAVQRFRTTGDLQGLLREEWPRHDLLIMAAAVADFRPVSPVQGKTRRTQGGLTLTLEATPDLLAEAASGRGAGQFIVGFALEPAETMLSAAREKLARKGIDAIVANPLETMDARTVTGQLILRDGKAFAGPPEADKGAFADWLLGMILRHVSGLPERTG